MSDDLAEQAKAVCAGYLERGQIALVLVWNPAGAFSYYNPRMRTDQFVELLRDALSSFVDIGEEQTLQ